MNVQTLDQGRITVAKEFLLLVQANGLDVFDKVMAIPGGEVMRDFPGRRTVRLEWASPEGRVQGVFLKRYEPRYLSAAGRLLRRLGWPSARDEAEREWQGIQAVRALGIRTAAPVAFGQQKLAGVVARSFLMTAEIVGGIDGDRHVRQLGPAGRRAFLARVAALTRRLHDGGLVHKDLYVSHILAAAAAGESPGQVAERESELYLIDLQRLMKPCCRGARWRVKDLGALAYSALKAGASPRDLLAAWLEYCGTKRLTPNERTRARRVLRRVAWLKTRTPKHDKDFQQLP